MADDRKRSRWKLAARMAARGWAARAREMMFTEPGESDGRAAERASANALAGEAGRLRGGVAKVAQMTAYFHGPAAATSEGARRTLSSLWDNLPPMDAARARAVVEGELGAAVADRFAAWDDRPLASASLGQVHAAEDAEGRALAVKVQYPEVADALRSDLASDRLVRELVGTGTSIDPSAIDAVRAAVLGELDYRAEAEALAAFADRFAGDSSLVIPRAVASLSTARVLTMERVRGTPIASWAGGDAPRHDRAEVAAAVFRFAWSSALVFGRVNADPNPGNYLVIPGEPPRVGLLDFGCTAALTDEERAGEHALWSAIVHHDAFEAADRVRANLADRGLVASARVLHGERYRAWEQALTEPFVARTDTRWDDAYAARLAETTSRLLAAGELRLPGNLALVWRQRLGVAAVLGTLGAELSWRALLGTVLAGA